MINILQTEFFRLKKSSLFWALFGVCAVIPLVSVVLNLLLISMMGTTNPGVEYDTWEVIRSSDMTLLTLSGLPGLTGDSLFALICTSIFLCKEFSGGTFRNMLLANRSRRELYLSYLLVAITIGATYFGTTYVSTLLFNGAIFGFGTLTAAKVVSACVLSLALGLVTVFFLQTMMCMFMFSTRKLAVTLACPLAIIIGLAFIYSFVETFAQFGLINATDMSWIPLYNLNLLDLSDIDGALIGKILLYMLPLTALFGTLGWVTFRKADLK